MNLKKIYNYSFLFIAAFPMFNLRWGTNFIILWAILSIYLTIAKKTYKDFKKLEVKEFTILSLYYIFLIGSYFLSGFNASISKFMETGASFFIFPLLITLNRKYIIKETLTKSLLVFYGANVILAILSWIKILRIGFYELQKQNDFYHPVFRNLFTDVTGIHLPYLGLFFVFSIFIGMLLAFKKERSTIINILVVFSVLLLLLSIVTFSARMALIIFIVGSVYLFLTKLKSYKIKATAILSLIISIVLLITQTPIKKRVNEIFDTKLELPSKALNDKEHTVNFRYGIYYCSYQIIKDNFWFGVGKGEVSTNLGACYDTFTFSGVNDFKKVKYNSHNQYIDMLMSYGIFGLLLLILALFYGVFRKPSVLYKVFLIGMFLALITENLFERQLGVVFFTFFNTLFFMINKNEVHEKSISA